jgi:hypothetical protein
MVRLGLPEEQAMTVSPIPTEAEKVVAELRDVLTDWDGADLPDAELPRVDVLCGTLRRAAALIEAQRATIERVERERDEAKALAGAQNGGNRHASAEWTQTLLKLREAQKERDAILAAGEALSLALSRYGFPVSDEAWRNTGDAAPANSQASIEARALHRAAAAFFREVSGAANVG